MTEPSIDSTVANPDSTRDDQPPGGGAGFLARRRVTIGFILGSVALWLARPTWWTLAMGGVVAVVGEAMRLWAAGHLEKDSEVTRSGPYRWFRHPLYVGSAILGAGLAVASAQPVVAGIVAVYLVATMTAAAHVEEARLDRRFGDEYQRYRDGVAAPVPRAFSLERALTTNREHRGIVGLCVGVGLLALKMWLVAS